MAATGKYIVMQSGSSTEHRMPTLGAARELARAFSSSGAVRANIYRDGHTGFDPVLERYERGHCVSRQRVAAPPKGHPSR